MEKFPVEILQEAEEEAIQARIWYAHRSNIAPVHFMQELDRANKSPRHQSDGRRIGTALGGTVCQDFRSWLSTVFCSIEFR